MLKIESARFEEGEKSKTGKYEYAGWYYRLTVGDIAYVVRRYDDTPEEASFLKSQIIAGQDLLFSAIPYDDARFREAVTYLLHEQKVKRPKIMLLRSGYEYLDLERLGQP